VSINFETIFLKDGENCSFKNKDELAAFLDTVFQDNGPWEPPARNNGRKTSHRERYCLRYFLKLNLEAFSYPIRVTKSERPDFLITDGEGVTLGVEHTDAGPESYQRWLAQIEESGEPSFYPNRDGKASDEGFSGTQMYREARADIIGSWIRKTGSINKYGYQKASSYILVSYLQSNAPLFLERDLDEIMSELPDYKCLSSYNKMNSEQSKSFTKVMVILGDKVKAWS